MGFSTNPHKQHTLHTMGGDLKWGCDEIRSEWESLFAGIDEDNLPPLSSQWLGLRLDRTIPFHNKCVKRSADCVYARAAKAWPAQALHCGCLWNGEASLRSLAGNWLSAPRRPMFSDSNMLNSGHKKMHVLISTDKHCQQHQQLRKFFAPIRTLIWMMLLGARGWDALNSQAGKQSNTSQITWREATIIVNRAGSKRGSGLERERLWRHCLRFQTTLWHCPTFVEQNNLHRKTTLQNADECRKHESRPCWMLKWQVLAVKQIVPKSSNLLKSSDLLQSDRVDVYDLFHSRSCDKLLEPSSLLWLF